MNESWCWIHSQKSGVAERLAGSIPALLGVDAVVMVEVRSREPTPEEIAAFEGTPSVMLVSARAESGGFSVVSAAETAAQALRHWNGRGTLRLTLESGGIVEDISRALQGLPPEVRGDLHVELLEACLGMHAIGGETSDGERFEVARGVSASFGLCCSGALATRVDAETIIGRLEPVANLIRALRQLDAGATVSFVELE